MRPQAKALQFRVAPACPEYPTKAMAERVLDAVLVFLECLLYPLVFKELTARSQEIVREEEDRPGGSPEFCALVLGESFRPVT